MIRQWQLCTLMVTLAGCMLTRDEIRVAHVPGDSGAAGDSSLGDPVAGDPMAGDALPGDTAGIPLELAADPSTAQATVTEGSPVSFQVQLSEQLARAVAWTASSNQSWLAVSPASGTTPATLTLEATTTTLPIGEANATVTVDLASPRPNDTGTSVSVSLDVVPVFATGFDPLGGPPGGSVSGIVVDPNDSQRILVANEEWYDYEGGALILLSTDGGASFDTVHMELDAHGGRGVLLPSGRGYWALYKGGIFRTDDSGDTWLATNLQGIEAWSVAASSTDPDLVLTADGTNLHKSVDGGVNWNIVSLAADAIAVINDPTDPTRFMVGDAIGNIYASDGTTFTPIPVDNDACGWDCQVVAFAASAAGRWVIANQDGSIGFTDDDGVSWTWGGGGAPDSVSELLFDGSGTLWAATWNAGLFQSPDGGANFYAVPSPGIQSGEIWPLATHPNGLLVGHEFEGLLRHQTDALVNTGLSAHALIELDYHVASGELVGISTTKVIFRWSRAGGFVNIVGDLALDGDVDLTDITIDPTNPANIMVSGRELGVVRTTDGGSTWLPSLGIPTDKVYSLSRAPDDPTVVWTGTDSGLYRSTNNGVTFTQMISGSTYDVAAVSTTTIVYDAGEDVYRVEIPSAPVLVVDESVWILVRAADGSILVGDPDSGIQRSIDGGLNFVPLGLAGEGPWDIEVDPNDPDRIFASYFQLDMMMSTDGGQNWSPMGAPDMTLGLTIDPVSSTLFIGGHDTGLMTWSE